MVTDDNFITGLTITRRSVTADGVGRNGQNGKTHRPVGGRNPLMARRYRRDIGPGAHWANGLEQLPAYWTGISVR